jgi:putative ribosome biogenesis GTPase RsgA
VFKTDKSSDLTQLQKKLAGKITVFMGHSGVGNSTDWLWFFYTLLLPW